VNLFRGQKVKVTRLINAVTKIVSYLPNGKAYNLEAWYTHTQCTKTRIPDKHHDFQGQRLQGHVVLLTGKLRMKHLRNTKIGRKVANCTGNNMHQLQGQKVNTMHNTQVAGITIFLKLAC